MPKRTQPKPPKDSSCSPPSTSNEFEPYLEVFINQVLEETRKSSYKLWRNIFTYYRHQDCEYQEIKKYYYHQLDQFSHNIQSCINQYGNSVKIDTKVCKLGILIPKFTIEYIKKRGGLLKDEIVGDYKGYIDLLLIKIRLEKLVLGTNVGRNAM